MTANNGLTVSDKPSALQNQLFGILTHLDNTNVKRLPAFQPTIATAKLNGILIDKVSKVTGFRGKAGVGGTVTDCIVKLYKVAKDGVVAAKVEVGSLTLAHASADGLNVAGTLSATAADLALAVGDWLYIEVTQAPTGGADLTVEATYEPQVS